MVGNAAGLFVVIAPMAAGFAGFGSLAGGLSRRHAGDDARMDAFRLATMLFSSLSAALLGLLPVTLENVLLAESAAVRISALVALAALAAYVPTGAWRVRKLRDVRGFSRSGGIANSICLLTAFVAFGVCATGAGSDRQNGFYLLGLFGLLCSSAVMFWRVITSMLRPSHEA